MVLVVSTHLIKPGHIQVTSKSMDHLGQWWWRGCNADTCVCVCVSVCVCVCVCVSYSKGINNNSHEGTYNNWLYQLYSFYIIIAVDKMDGLATQSVTNDCQQLQMWHSTSYRRRWFKCPMVAIRRSTLIIKESGEHVMMHLCKTRLGFSFTVTILA